MDSRLIATIVATVGAIVLHSAAIGLTLFVFTYLAPTNSEVMEIVGALTPLFLSCIYAYYALKVMLQRRPRAISAVTALFFIAGSFLVAFAIVLADGPPTHDQSLGLLIYSGLLAVSAFIAMVRVNRIRSREAAERLKVFD